MSQGRLLDTGLIGSLSMHNYWEPKIEFFQTGEWAKNGQNLEVCFFNLLFLQGTQLSHFIFFRLFL